MLTRSWHTVTKLDWDFHGAPLLLQYWEHTLPSSPDFITQTPSYSDVLNPFQSFNVLQFVKPLEREELHRASHSHTDKNLKRSCGCLREASFSPQRSVRLISGPHWGGGGSPSLSNTAGDLQHRFVFLFFSGLLSLTYKKGSVFVNLYIFYYLRRWTMSHDKMCTKRMARPMLSRITMQIMMVFGP